MSRRSSRSRWSSIGAVVLCAFGGMGCATTQRGATPDELTRARSGSERGATVFANECATCHGQRGEGLGSAAAILGPGALPEFPRASTAASDPTLIDPALIQMRAQTRPAGAPWRDPFRNAQDLYTFTKTHVPKSRAADLKDEDYWALVTYVLAVQGAALPPSGIGPGNAASIPIPKR